MKITYSIFYTTDITRIEKYYLDNFNWKPKKSNEKFLEYSFGNASLGIKLGDKKREVPGYQTTIFHIENIEDLYNNVKSKGLNIYKELVRQDWGTSFSVLDIDGNKVEFAEINKS